MGGVAALPALRDELALHPGPAAADGGPSWTLHDPLSNRFFRLSWPAFEVLSRWHLGHPDLIAEAVRRETTLDVGDDDVLGVVEFLARGQLLKPQGGRDVDRLLSIHDAHQTSWATWLLHHYLFFRIPLVRPDALLGRLYPAVAWVGSRAFRGATLGALALGLILAGRQWDVFVATFVDHFSLTGLAAFGVALGVAKVLHELGHAFTAKGFGCRVPTMGVAFLVMWPMLYTDVNEAWKLTDRRQRLLVGGAGILAELALAAWATLAWGLLPDGGARSVAFTLAATTWISSLAINLSPFMRFDGYFLAMDALDQPNLHPRSFALARWHLREVLFGLGEPVPEPLPARTQVWMIAFAWAVWIYRLILFLGIAVLVYHFFIKVVGIMLFAVEIGWFVLRPFWSELAEWKTRLPAIRGSRRSRAPLAGLGLVLLILVVPWNGRVSAPALLKAERHSVVYAPVPAQLLAVEVGNGQQVAAGAVLARLDNPDLALRLAQAERRAAVLRYELSAIGFEESFRVRAKATAEELEAVQAEVAALSRDLRRLTLTAAAAGTVTDVTLLAQPGQWIGPHEPLLAVRQGAQIDAYVSEDDLPRLSVGGRATFVPDGSGGSLAANIVAIDRVAIRSLTDPALAAPYGGTIAARFSDKALVPDGALYRVRLVPVAVTAVTVPLRGSIHMDGERRSLVGHALTAMAAVLIRELGM
ncbi:MAG TPA: HlyD family efflux transporter periplasmic adaptor subunit [Magnetospirillum sp.]|nr:HlyD family efflux transporter periplasmic adaptor subunit [Magnetospirillum sp.]